MEKRQGHRSDDNINDEGNNTTGSVCFQDKDQ